VVVFWGGGAWLIGYRAWAAFVGRLLTARGFIVFAPDYRNFPQGTVADMLEDVDTAMEWIYVNATHYGGDADNIAIVAQSAGAHLSLLSLLRHTASRLPSVRRWPAHRLRHFIGVSGPYDLVADARHFHRQGLSASLMARIFLGDLAAYSPVQCLRSYFGSAGASADARRLPPVTLIHGTRDKTVSFASSERLVEELERHGHTRARLKLYPYKGHTDFLVEDPITGDAEPLIDDLVRWLRETAPRPSDASYLADEEQGKNEEEDGGRGRWRVVKVPQHEGTSQAPVVEHFTVVAPVRLALWKRVLVLAAQWVNPF